jgi:catechol 2,3-dioxygenase-like lactoylglutathione lyase family enzyme
MQVVQGNPESDHVILRDAQSRMEIALMRAHDTTGRRFDKSRIGLNHAEFGVTSEQELANWGAYLDAKRIPRLPVEGHSGARWITFRDPDGIILEFCWVVE